MEFGIGMFGDLIMDNQIGKYEPVSQRFGEIIEEAKLADELGIDVFQMGEHHRADFAVSSPEILLAALSTVTKKIKLASGVNVVSSADPVKLYQDFAMIDLISGQRAEITAGRGSFIESFPLFGYELQDYNELFSEKLDLLLELNKKEVINWKGKFRAPVVEQTVFPRPGREIPIWIAVGGTPSSVARAARLGLPIIFAIIGGQTRQFLPLIEYYKENYLRYGHDPEKMQIAVHSHTFVSDSEQEVLDKYYPLYVAQMEKIGRERGWASGYSIDQFKGGMSPHGALYMGEPNRIAEKIIATTEMFGITRFVAHVDVGGPTHLQLMKSIEMFGDKVIPQVKKALAK